MSHRYLQVAVTPSVAAAQLRYFGRAQTVTGAPERDVLGEEERAFIAARDSFYLATVSETGWPYVQHRGGPAGFLRMLGPHQLGFADLRGNRQMISTGNIAHASRVSLLLMDYPRRSRLKILGEARVVTSKEDPRLAETLAAAAGVPAAAVDRMMVVDVVGFDWNCPKYITPRYTAAEVDEVVRPLRAKIAELEAQLRDASRPANGAIADTGPEAASG